MIVISNAPAPSQARLLSSALVSLRHARSLTRRELFSCSLHRICLLVCSVVCLTLPAIAFGQATEFGTLNGTVTDIAGRALVNAHVEATNVGTHGVFAANTNSSGQYRIFNLLPQTYTLSVAAPGFKTISVAAFKLDVGESLTQNAKLPVGAVTEMVQVEAEGQLLETTTVGSTTTVQQQMLNDLPLNGRNYTSLIQLSPGADGTRINGQFSDGNRYVLDGSSNTTLLGASSAYVPNLDLIQEFSIDSHSSKAEEGGFLGATITAATKSGTNQVHGDIFEFNRNNEFNARNPVTNPPGVAFPPFHQNQYGGVVGGPVIIPKIYNGHDKTFFFAGFQGLTLHQQTYSYSRVPTAAELQGNFANSLFFTGSPNQVHLFDPATTSTGNPPTRTAFAGDVIPTNRINQTVVGYLQYVLPAPNFTPNAAYPTSNRVDLYPNPTLQRDYSLRVDHHISARDNAWVRYSQYSNTSTSQATNNIAQINRSPRKDIVADWVHFFTPRLFLESNYAYVYLPSSIDNTFPGGAAQSLTGVGFSAAQIAEYGLPDFNGTGTNTPGLYGHYEQGQVSPFNLTESISWNLGKHNVKSGVILSRKHYTNTSVGHHYGFSSTQTSDPSGAPNSGNTGNGLASALLGLPSSVSLYYGNYEEEFLNWAVYAEDEWKVLPHLTIDAGLRYDNFPTPNFLQGTINDWDAFTGIWYIGGGKLPSPCTTSPVAPCIPGTGNLADLPFGNMIQVAPTAGIRHAIHDNFGPRIGFAWNFQKNLVLRAGYGIYFDAESNTTQEDQNTFGTWPSSTNVNLSYNQVGGTQTTLSQIDSQALSPTTTGVPWGTQSFFWDPAKKNAMSQQWNVDFQQQWSRSVVTTIAYVGSLQTRVDLTLDENAATTPGPARNAATINALRPFPFYGTDTKFGTSLGRGNYNSLQVKIEKRLSHDLQGLISYTWSKSMDNGSNAYYGSNVQNSYNINAAYGISDVDRTHILRMEATYQLPFGKGKMFLNHGPLAYIFGGWQVNALGQANSGRPIVLSASNDPAHIGNTQTTYARPDLVGSPDVAKRTRAAWFNQAAFAQPNGTFGNAPRGLFRNPPFQNMDASVFKNIPVRERISMQLRLEAYNALNLITLGGVNGSYTNNKNFGTITGIGSTPRILQIGGKLYF